MSTSGREASEVTETLHGTSLPLCPSSSSCSFCSSRPAHLGPAGPAPGRPRVAPPGARPQKFQRLKYFSVSSRESERGALNLAVIRSSDSSPPWPRSSDVSVNLVRGIWFYRFSVENTRKVPESWKPSSRKLLGCSNQTLPRIAPAFLHYLFLIRQSHLQQVAEGETSALLIYFLCYSTRAAGQWEKGHRFQLLGWIIM